jgi:hypothetical protein
VFSATTSLQFVAIAESKKAVAFKVSKKKMNKHGYAIIN